MEGVPRLLTIQQANEQLEALGLPPRTVATFMNWIERYGMGYKVGGNWVLVEDKFRAFLLGEYDKEKT